MDENIYYYAAIGSSIIILSLILYFVFRKKDPLPEKDPKCLWHTTAKVTKVYDGDTIFAHVKGHKPIDKKPVGIRVRGIDTPEMKSKRPAVRKKAQKAKELVEEQVRKAGTVHLYNVNLKDKYGRMLATVFCGRTDLAKLLLKKKLAKAYDGGKKPKW